MPGDMPGDMPGARSVALGEKVNIKVAPDTK